MSCTSVRVPHVGRNEQVILSVDLTQGESSISFKGVCNFSADSNILFIYGPLAVNVARIVAWRDSIIIVDILHKRIYRGRYYNVSGGIYNFFNGVYTLHEQQLLCTLCLLMDNGANCCSSLGDKPVYKFEQKLRNTQIICKLTPEIEISVLKSRNKRKKSKTSLSGNLNKYSNFENVYLKFPQ